jgi:hypothetical protein
LSQARSVISNTLPSRSRKYAQDDAPFGPCLMSVTGSTTEWELTATCVTAQVAVGQGGAARRARQPLSAVQFASITHTMARDGVRP